MGKLSPDKIFPEFASLKPQPSTLTLRSHITGKKKKIDIAGPVLIGVRAEIAKA